jgi:nucleotide-binding universal stress UspA family protein
MATLPFPVFRVPVRIPQFARILVPIDFTDTSSAALDHAIEIAKLYHSSIALVHVMGPPVSKGIATISAEALLKPELDLRDDLDNLRRMVIDQGIPCTSLFRKGNIPEQLHDVLRDNPIDLLVLATHGGHSVYGVFLGSTAERLIRAISIPVITIGRAANQSPWDQTGPRHILFAGDFAPETLCGLSLALGIQQAAGAHLSIVHAVSQGKPHAVDAIREKIKMLVPPGTEIHTPAGPIGKTVCEVARSIQPDLLALGVHRNSFSREVFGSHLVEILLNAPCPVLSVRQCID